MESQLPFSRKECCQRYNIYSHVAQVLVLSEGASLDYPQVAVHDRSETQNSRIHSKLSPN